jgi:hypothetical protein
LTGFTGTFAGNSAAQGNTSAFQGNRQSIAGQGTMMGSQSTLLGGQTTYPGPLSNSRITNQLHYTTTGIQQTVMDYKRSDLTNRTNISLERLSRPFVKLKKLSMSRKEYSISRLRLKSCISHKGTTTSRAGDNTSRQDMLMQGTITGPRTSRELFLHHLQVE